jgi:hypothetical protein
MTNQELGELLWVHSQLKLRNLPNTVIVMPTDRAKETEKAYFSGTRWYPKSIIRFERTTDTNELFFWCPKWFYLKG